MHATPKAAFTGVAHVCATLALALIVFVTAQPAQAQTLIRDAEIEASLKRISAPLFKAAGISASSVEVLVVDDPSLNAYVVNNRAIFLHSGLIMRMRSVDMLQYVIGHELAHITAGHLVRRSLNQQNTMTAIGVGMLLSVAASMSGHADAGTTIALGVTSGAINNLLAHTRSEETTADQISVQYMVLAGLNPNAGVKVLNLFKDQEALSVSRQDAYTSTHPLSQDRIRALETLIDIYASQVKPVATDDAYWFDRMQAKFRGFLGAPGAALRSVKAGDNSEAARLARAVAYHRLPDVQKSMIEINALLALRPDDAYYHELKGQFFLEGGNAGAAVASYQKAVDLDPKAALILAGLGRALLATHNAALEKQALEVLKRARDMDGRDASMLRDLALAYAKSGDNGMAALVTAERYALLTQFKDAQTNALRAEGLLPRGSSGWLRAEDIIAATKIALKK